MSAPEAYPGAVTLRASDGTSASVVPALGAVVSSLCFPVAGALREVLFRHAHFGDAASDATRGGIPFLFPLCGRLQRDGRFGEYVCDGRTFTLPIHGFAMRRPWRVKEQASDRVVLSLDAMAEEGYPFMARLSMEIEAQPRRVLLEAEIENCGDTPMPFSGGWHPYFLTPDAGPGKGGVCVRLPARQAGRYDPSYTHIPEWSEPLPSPLVPTHPLFKEVLHRVDSGAVSVDWPGLLSLELRAELDSGTPFPFWQLHTEREKPFVCVEPWSSPPNALNSGESLLHLAPSARRRMQMTISLASARAESGR
ncbi:MAG: hypothetical protein J5I99_01005 [Verrucomicrobia bacterium]|nr:hypothetical protein [Kiritimatiellia bacterium]MCO6399789.1 hypothetical protein [Verrucomicrobiota bacterium]